MTTTYEFLENLKDNLKDDYRTRLFNEGRLDIGADILVRVFFRDAEAMLRGWGKDIPVDHAVLCVRVGAKYEVLVKLDMIVPLTDLGPDMINRIRYVVDGIGKMIENAKKAFPYDDLGLGGH